jgi:hypothetical protein
VTPSRKAITKYLKFRDRVRYHVVVRRKKLPPEIRAFFVTMGKRGGKLGGPARAAKLTPEQRSENARKAVMARWAKAKKPVV